MVSFHNSSSKNVYIAIDGEEIASIKAGESFTYYGEIRHKSYLTLGHFEESFVKGKKVFLQIQTGYELDFAVITELYISREKMRIDSYAYYDYFILRNDKGIVMPICYKVLGEEKLKKELKRCEFTWRFYDAFKDMVMEILISPLASFIIGGIIVWVFGWKWLIITIGALYFLSFIGTYRSGKINKLLVKLFGEKFRELTMEQRFEKWVDTEYIAEFYLNPNKKPYMGKVER